MKSACEAQWNSKKIAYPLYLAGWKPTADKQGIFKIKGRKVVLTQILSLRAKQKWRCLEHQKRG